MELSWRLFMVFLFIAILYFLKNHRLDNKLLVPEPLPAFRLQQRSGGLRPSELLIGDTTTFVTSDKSEDFQKAFFKNFPVKQYSTKSSKRGLPKLMDIKFANKFWQILSIGPKTSKIYLLSAFYDIRVEPPVIRIVAGIHEEVDKNQIVNCHIWFKNQDEPKIVQAITDVSGSVEKFKNVKPAWHFPKTITCHLDCNSTNQIPELVSLAWENATSPSNILKVTYNPARIENRDRVALCVKRVFEPSRENILPLIEWFETQLALGVSKVFMYVLHAHINFIKVLDYYWQKGVLEVTPVTYPGNVMASEPFMFKKQRDLPHSQVVRWRTDEYDYEDCLLRNMYNYDVLTPEKKGVTLVKLLDQLESQKKISTDYDAISFRNLYYESPVSQKFPPTGKFIIDNRKRSTTVQRYGYISKVLYNTRTVIGAGNHKVNQCINKSCKTFHLPLEIGSSHHYRYKIKTKTDFATWKPLPWFNKRVKKTSREIFEEISKFL